VTLLFFCLFCSDLMGCFDWRALNLYSFPVSVLLVGGLLRRCCCLSSCWSG
jgi:hypothetical protein